MGIFESNQSIENFEIQFFGNSLKNMNLGINLFYVGKVQSALANSVYGLVYVFFIILDEDDYNKIEPEENLLPTIKLLKNELTASVYLGKKEHIYSSVFSMDRINMLTVGIAKTPNSVLYIINRNETDRKFVFPNLSWSKTKQSWSVPIK